MGQRRETPGGGAHSQSPVDAALELGGGRPRRGVCIMVLMVPHGFRFYKFLAHSVVLLPSERQCVSDAALWLSISARVEPSKRVG